MTRNRISQAVFSYLLAFLFLLGLWWFLAWLIDNPGFPYPFTVAVAFIKLFPTSLWGHLCHSLRRVLVSLSLGLVVGLPLGFWAGRDPRADAFLSPLIYLLYPVPKVAFLPVILVLLGIGEASKILIVFLVVFSQILISSRDAVKKIPREYILAVSSLGAGRGDIYLHVILPACLPDIFTALRISLGSAIAVLFFSESLAGNTGLGYFIFDGLFRAEYAAMGAGILALALMGLGLYGLLHLLQRLLCPWSR
ncbi:MAG TPA: ABC transporter permease [Moorella mulderi]|nr:ABC transporter permease [Moorella mulderi]